MSSLLSAGTLFGRRYQVTLGTPARRNQAVYGNMGGGSPLKVEFDVEKTDKPMSNKATVSITNMAPQNRAALAPGMLVTLVAGYAGNVQTLFFGVVTKPTSDRQGPDVVTKIEMGDGESAITRVTFDRSYNPGTSLAQVLSDIAQAMQTTTATNPTGVSAGPVLGIPDVFFSRGLSVHGPVRQTLTKLCKPQGLNWSIQNGALQIVPVQHHTGETAEVLSQSTGLIGIPSFDGKTLHFSALLNPRLTPGRLVQIISQPVTGYFKIVGGKWQGDSHGQPWNCDLEGIRVGAKQAFSSAGGFDYQADVTEAVG